MFTARRRKCLERGREILFVVSWEDPEVLLDAVVVRRRSRRKDFVVTGSCHPVRRDVWYGQYVAFNEEYWQIAYAAEEAKEV